MFSLDKIKNLNLEPGNPVVGSWLASDSHYGFVEFRSTKESDIAYEFLQGMKFLGQELRIGRPKNYLEVNGLNSLG